MAVKRCPYCKAIIDEGAEYCTNCGTKLLFPEDEAIQEEIPGEILKHSDFPDEDEQEEGEEEAEKKKRVSENEQEEQVAEIEEDKEEIDSPPAPPKKSKSKRGRFSSKTKKVEPVVVADDGEPEIEVAEAAVEEEVKDVVVDEAAEDIEPEPEDLEEVIDVQEEVKMEIRRGKTEDLPDGFAETIEEAKTRAEEDEKKSETEEPEAEETEDEVPIEKADDEIVEVDDSEAIVDGQVPMDEAGKVYDESEELAAGKKSESDEQLREPSRYEEATVKTNDIEEIVDESEVEKKEIESFIESVKKERENGLQIDETGELPPWAEGMGGTPPPPMPPTDEIELREEEASEEIEEVIEDVERWEAENVPQPDDEPEEEAEPPVEQIPGPAPGYDTSSAFPETVAVDQKGLPFRGDTQEEPVKDIAPQEAPYQTDSYQEEPYKDEPIPEESIEDEVEEAAVSTEAPRTFRIRPRRRTTPIPFIDWIKARIFDVLFIAALWFITLWAASQVLEISVFQLIMASFTLTLIFLGILLALYFFFFLFFLGETLGNYLFSQEE